MILPFWVLLCFKLLCGILPPRNGDIERGDIGVPTMQFGTCQEEKAAVPSFCPSCQKIHKILCDLEYSLPV